MKTKITKIGNSQGIILPKNIIEQCKFKDIVKLEIKDNCLLVSHQNPRQRWEEAIMRAGIDDEILIEDSLATNRTVLELLVAIVLYCITMIIAIYN